MLEIIKNEPMPITKRPSIPLSKMDVGDCVRFDLNDFSASKNAYGLVKVWAYRAARKTKTKVKILHEGNFVTVWRIA